jgi:predicted GTPase
MSSLTIQQLLPKMHDLEKLISEVTNISKIDILPAELKNDFITIKHAIPQIVVFGSQSSGKSSVLNKMFQTNLKTGVGMCTKCPIEIRYDPSYKKEEFFVINEHNQLINTFSTFEEAQQCIDENSQGQLLPVFIIYQKPSTETFIITDLPGFHINYDRTYFDYLKHKYLDNKSSIVLHVTRGDSDPLSDISREILQNIPNKVIPVLTNSDIWIQDEDKFSYFRDHQQKSNSDTISVVNNKENELDILNVLDLTTSKTLIKGSQQLKEHCMNETLHKLTQNIPYYKNIIDKVLISINKILSNIGFTKPDFKMLTIEFRNEMKNRIKNEFENPNTNHILRINETKENINSDNIYKYIHVLPSEEELATMMKNGSRGKLYGSEGWDRFIKQYISTIIFGLKTDIINPFIDTYSNIIYNTFKMLLSTDYKPSTNEIQNKLLKDIPAIIQKHKEHVMQTIGNELNIIEKYQYNEDSSYISEYTKSIAYDPIVKTIEFFYEQKDYKSAIEQAKKNPERIVNLIASQMNNDVYFSNAKFAKTQLVCFWKSKANVLPNYILGELHNFEENILQDMIQYIELVNPRDFVELDVIDFTRKKLIEICRLSEDIKLHLI